MDLIIDTSTEKLQVILGDKNTFINNSTTNPKHLKHLLPQIENFLYEIMNNCILSLKIK
jgi:tRNA A37 threonylcarbamoyladenosine modification protein TsaB